MLLTQRSTFEIYKGLGTDAKRIRQIETRIQGLISRASNFRVTSRNRKKSCLRHSKEA